ENALELCKKQQIKYAILAEGSPSCGSSKIYDGTFNGIKIDGSGVTTALLERNGIKVFSQHTIAKLREALEKIANKLFKRDSQRVAFLLCVDFSD
ncbi:DUF523 domain-containing protein, partial [Vibrio parahaemolyticus]|nr:DUF523 domain-containing protein [Vibrio parahaemolyticus]